MEQMIYYDSGWIEKQQSEFIEDDPANKLHEYIANLCNDVLIDGLDEMYGPFMCEGVTGREREDIDLHFDDLDKANWMHRVRVSIPDTDVRGTFYIYCTDNFVHQPLPETRLIFTTRSASDLASIYMNID